MANKSVSLELFNEQKPFYFWRVYGKNLTYVQSESWFLIDVSRLIHEGVSFHAYQNKLFSILKFCREKLICGLFSRVKQYYTSQLSSQHFRIERIFLHVFERFSSNFSTSCRKENFNALRRTGRKFFFLSGSVLSEIIGLLSWQAQAIIHWFAVWLKKRKLADSTPLIQLLSYLLYCKIISSFLLTVVPFEHLGQN